MSYGGSQEWQRLRLRVQAKADNTGTAVLIFDRVPPGLVWTGSAAVVDSPVATPWIAHFQVVADAGSGAWTGVSPYGPFQLLASEQLILVGTGLTPDRLVTGVFIGFSAPAEDAPFLSVAPTSATAIAIGGTVDSVGSVTGNVGGNVQGNVAGNVAGAVGSVAGDVAGSVAGSVATVAGNVGGNVTGSVSSVVNQFFLTRELFFWPAVSGETFPPTLTSMLYTSALDKPGYGGSVNNVGSQGTLIFPNVARTAPISLNQALILEWWVYLPTLVGWGNALNIAYLSYGAVSGSATARHVGIKTLSDAAGNALNWRALSRPGAGAETVTDLGIAPAAGWTDLKMVLNTNGSIDYYVNGVLAVNIAGIWNPHATTSALNLFGGTGANGASPTALLSQIQASYSA